LYEVQTTATAIEEATGKAPTLLRPPGGSITNLRVAESPYSIILWNVDTKDWQYRNADTVARNILTSTTPGDIILMHDIYPSTLEAIKLALPLLAEQGYEFVTVSELLGDEMQPGKKYNKAY
jgi:peptidoglycan/xylan/chitin deacetylase (PgdA/CDA1 family)